ncbi:hypothetical protein ACHAXS_001382 [Conticribra weissflogii]
MVSTECSLELTALRCPLRSGVTDMDRCVLGGETPASMSSLYFTSSIAAIILQYFFVSSSTFAHRAAIIRVNSKKPIFP